MEDQWRLSCPVASTTPASRHAATARSAPARVSASGFSQQTGLPARAAATTCSTCRVCGVASTTASTRGSASASSSLDDSSRPCWTANSAHGVGPPRHAADELRRVADSLDRAHQVLAPAAESDDGRVDHRTSPSRAADSGSFHWRTPECSAPENIIALAPCAKIRPLAAKRGLPVPFRKEEGAPCRARFGDPRICGRNGLPVYNPDGPQGEPWQTPIRSGASSTNASGATTSPRCGKCSARW